MSNTKINIVFLLAVAVLFFMVLSASTVSVKADVVDANNTSSDNSTNSNTTNFDNSTDYSNNTSNNGTFDPSFNNSTNTSDPTPSPSNNSTSNSSDPTPTPSNNSTNNGSDPTPSPSNNSTNNGSDPTPTPTPSNNSTNNGSDPTPTPTPSNNSTNNGSDPTPSPSNNSTNNGSDPTPTPTPSNNSTNNGSTPTPTPIPVVQPPTDVTVSNVTATTAVISWVKSTNDAYEFTIVAGTTSVKTSLLSYQLTDLQQASTYNVSIVASFGGYSSSPVYVTIQTLSGSDVVITPGSVVTIRSPVALSKPVPVGGAFKVSVPSEFVLSESKRSVASSSFSVSEKTTGNIINFSSMSIESGILKAILGQIMNAGDYVVTLSAKVTSGTGSAPVATIQTLDVNGTAIETTTITLPVVHEVTVSASTSIQYAAAMVASVVFAVLLF